MEYIQCSHCQKRYGVSDKIRAAVGKRIRCKQCGEAFVITILMGQRKADSQSSLQTQRPQPANTAPPTPDRRKSDAPPPPPQLPDDAAPSHEQAARPAEIKRKPTKAVAIPATPINLSMPTPLAITLGVMILASTGYLYQSNPEIFGADAPLAVQDSEDQKALFARLATPATPFSVTVRTLGIKSEQSDKKTVADAENKPAEKKNELTDSPANKSALQSKDSRSQECRNIAADFWVGRFLLTHIQLSTTEYMDIFNKRLGQSDQIRELCKDDTLVAALTESASKDQVPEWISDEIKKIRGDQKNGGSGNEPTGSRIQKFL